MKRILMYQGLKLGLLILLSRVMYRAAQAEAKKASTHAG